MPAKLGVGQVSPLHNVRENERERECRGEARKSRKLIVSSVTEKQMGKKEKREDRRESE